MDGRNPQDWRAFFHANRTALLAHYPGLTEPRFLREAQEIGGDGSAFLRGEPFAYLLGYAEFYGRKFKVDSRVLIPRPETEQLAERALVWMRAQARPMRVVDVGAGSGCLGLTVALEGRGVELTLTDLSPDALAVARENVLAHGVAAEVLEGDLLDKLDGDFDLVLSNPPYIPLSEQKRSVHAQVDTYEPALALYVSDESYQAFFRRLFGQVARRLRPGGAFWMEGHEARLDECALWAAEEGLVGTRIEKDFADAPRFLVFQR